MNTMTPIKQQQQKTYLIKRETLKEWFWEPLKISQVLLIEYWIVILLEMPIPGSIKAAQRWLNAIVHFRY